jgi:hypothetical protein
VTGRSELIYITFVHGHFKGQYHEYGTGQKCCESMGPIVKTCKDFIIN